MFYVFLPKTTNMRVESKLILVQMRMKWLPYGVGADMDFTLLIGESNGCCIYDT